MALKQVNNERAVCSGWKRADGPPPAQGATGPCCSLNKCLVIIFSTGDLHRFATEIMNSNWPCDDCADPLPLLLCICAGASAGPLSSVKFMLHTSTFSLCVRLEALSVHCLFFSSQILFHRTEAAPDIYEPFAINGFPPPSPPRSMVSLSLSG